MAKMFLSSESPGEVFLKKREIGLGRPVFYRARRNTIRCRIFGRGRMAFCPFENLRANPPLDARQIAVPARAAMGRGAVGCGARLL